MTLTTAEAGKLLAAIRLIDNRQWDDATAAAWTAMLDPDITLPEAVASVRHHFASSTEYLMPAHINRIVAAVRAERRQRITDAGPPDFPDDLTYQQEQAYRRAYHALVGDGMAKADAQAQLDQSGGFDRKQLTGPPQGFQKQLEGMFRPVSRRITTWGRWKLRGQELVLGANRYRIPLEQLGDLEQWAERLERLGFKADVVADLKAAHLDLMPAKDGAA